MQLSVCAYPALSLNTCPTFIKGHQKQIACYLSNNIVHSLVYCHRWQINPWNAEIFVYEPWRPKVIFQFEIIVNVFSLYMNTYVMGLRPFKYLLFQCGNRLQTPESGVYRRQILTSKINACTERVISQSVHFMQFCEHNFSVLWPPHKNIVIIVSLNFLH